MTTWDNGISLFPVAKIRLLEHYVLKQLRDDLYYWSCRVGSESLGIDHEFFVDHLIVIRIHYPDIVNKTGGGLLFRTELELRSCLHRLLGNPSEAAELGCKASLGFSQHWSEDVAMAAYFDVIRKAAETRGMGYASGLPDLADFLTPEILTLR